VRWQDFAAACPELAEIGRRRFAEDEVVLIGTIRRDGSPRISPVEPDLAAGELCLGMMWRSMKALDLLRDPRLVVHTATKDRHGTAGDLKLYGTARDVEDADLRGAYKDAIEARIAWRPEGDFHCFVVDIESAAFVRFDGGTQITIRWDPELGTR
jgi:hypothetical protein